MLDWHTCQICFPLEIKLLLLFHRMLPYFVSVMCDFTQNRAYDIKYDMFPLKGFFVLINYINLSIYLSIYVYFLNPVKRTFGQDRI